MRLSKSPKNVAFCGITTAFAIVLGYIEHMIPLPVGIYGLKLGLANLAILSLLYITDAKKALTVQLIRIILCAILFGNAFSVIYSLCGGIFSFIIMVLLKNRSKFSPVGVSICAAIAHNIAQFTVAVIIVDQIRIALYLPVLIIFGAISGLIIGTCSLPVIHQFSKNK